jgi:hypothetical protein
MGNINGNSIMAGMIHADASAPLGLPDCYGQVCVVLGFVVVALVLWFCPNGCASEAESPAKIVDPA